MCGDYKTDPAQRAKSVKFTWGGDITYHTDIATTRLRDRFSENAIIKQKKSQPCKQCLELSLFNHSFRN